MVLTLSVLCSNQRSLLPSIVDLTLACMGFYSASASPVHLGLPSAPIFHQPFTSMDDPLCFTMCSCRFSPLYPALASGVTKMAHPQERSRPSFRYTLQTTRHAWDTEHKLAEEEQQLIVKQIKLDSRHDTSWIGLFSRPATRRRLLLAMFLMFLQQSNGLRLLH